LIERFTTRRPTIKKNLKFLLLLFGFASAAFGPDVAVEGPFVIHQIVGDPSEAGRVFAITSNYGVLKSEDGGVHWRHANRGLKSFTHHAIAITSGKRHRLYLGGWAGGVSTSGDNGETWSEMNDQLGNTAVDAIAVDPGTPDRLYAATSTQFFRSNPEGKWEPFGEGLPPFPDDIKFKSLLLLPGPPKTLWYGNSQGLYYRSVDAPRWTSEENFKDVPVTALAYDERSRRLWVGTIDRGLFFRDNKEKKWRKVSVEKGTWINGIVVDPGDPGRLLLATRGKGVLKTIDGGKSWKLLDQGLDVKDIRSLALHPLNRSLLFAGTTSKGIFRSTDGGNHWEPVKPLPVLSMDEIIAMLSPNVQKNEETDRSAHSGVPPSFVKCNRCHGWTDPLLNWKKTYWRVPPNLRDWGKTVERMSERAKLTAEEKSAITAFLTSYSRRVEDEGKSTK
jgi:photosystem II stability/assembly factor-like uncharacterized protein